MNNYEFTFIIDELEDRLVDKLYDSYDCLIASDHHGQEQIVITASGNTALEAGKNVHLGLVGAGVRVRSIEFDLSSRSEIARRLGKTPQAVGNWIRGDRQSNTPFPAPFSDVAGGVWLWGDVVSWIRVVGGSDPAPGFSFPTRSDVEDISVCIRNLYDTAKYPKWRYDSGSITVASQESFAVVHPSRAARTMLMHMTVGYSTAKDMPAGKANA